MKQPLQMGMKLLKRSKVSKRRKKFKGRFKSRRSKKRKSSRRSNTIKGDNTINPQTNSPTETSLVLEVRSKTSKDLKLLQISKKAAKRKSLKRYMVDRGSQKQGYKDSFTKETIPNRKKCN